MQGASISGFEVLSDDTPSGSDESLNHRFELVIDEKGYFLTSARPDADTEVVVWAALTGSTLSVEYIRPRKGRMITFADEAITHPIPAEGKQRSLRSRRPA